MSDVVERVAREEAPSREELIANLEYATKLLGAWPILNATAQVQHLRSVVARARPAALADATPDIGKEGVVSDVR